MKRLLEAKHSVVLIPGGVQECLHLGNGNTETVFLRRRFGFCKLALQTGSPLVPAFSFGQSRTFRCDRQHPRAISRQ